MKLSELAAALGLSLRGAGEEEVSAAAPIDGAGPGTVTFLSSARFVSALAQVRPAAVITTAELAPQVTGAVLLSANPQLDFARALGLFHRAYRPARAIHPTAQIAPSARIGPGASIGAFVVIGERVQIGRDAVIHPHVVIYPDVIIGDGVVCHSQVSIREGVRLGDRVTIHNGAVLGSEGFGFVQQGEDLVKIPQIGQVLVESEVEIGALAAIDRATVGVTVVRRGVKLDNFVHIGHNCEIGAFSRFAAQSGVGGSSMVGEWCEFGGQSGVADHVRIGRQVRVAAGSGIPGAVADNSTVGGRPAVPIRLWRRQSAILRHLPELVARLRALEEKLGMATRSREDRE
jgi:UDP-3-O-[3-hydroxymyristoyl] glucosamine N-acyltransferase